MITRRRLVALCAASTLASATRAARAQSWPNRVVRLVVPFAPAGGVDVVGRLLANRLSEIWGQQIVVENKGGAGGNIAAEFVARSEPDGYTMFIVSIGHAINRHIFASLSYDPVADFAPVTLICVYPNVMVVPMSSPAHSVKEFIDYAKAKKGVTFASSSSGTSVHLAGELFKRMAGVEMTHIPYRGAGPALNNLIPGRVDVMFATASTAVTQIRSGTLRGLAVTTPSGSRSRPSSRRYGRWASRASTCRPGLRSSCRRRRRPDCAETTGIPQGFAGARDDGEARPTRRQRGRVDAGGARRPPQVRDREMGPDHQGSRHPRQRLSTIK